jgi:hypothetical protein
MNAKIVIPISIIIVITIATVVFSLTENEAMEKETSSEITSSTEIQSILNKIKEDKIKNDDSENSYEPKEREWIQSGPFMIDRSEYILGEKIFINIGDMDKNIHGEMIFSKIINNTHTYDYKKIQFDSSNPQKNFYLGFNLNKNRGICTVDQFVGDWELVFKGTKFDKININILKFKVIDQILPGMEKNYKPVC